MAVKFKSKYTAQEIEQILDAVQSAAISGAIIEVSQLPEINQANKTSFYKLDDKLFFSNGSEWVEVGKAEDDPETTGGTPVDPAEGVIDTNGGAIYWSDFVQYDDELHFVLTPDSATDIYFKSLRNQMESEKQRYFTLVDAEAYGFIDGLDENNLLSAMAALNHDCFFVKVDLVDGHEVDITREQTLEDGRELYLIEYVGYAL